MASISRSLLRLCYSVSHYWNTMDEIGCRWDDPALGLDWQIRRSRTFAALTQAAGTAAEMTQQFLAVREQLRASRD